MENEGDPSKISSKTMDTILDPSEFHDKIVTYITHNKGATWERIRAPETDLKGQSSGCFLEDKCSLHL